MPDGKRFRDAKALRDWFRVNASRRPEVWILFAKKGTGVASVTQDEAVEEALCVGWIDSQMKSVDETYYRVRFTPRRVGSNWSERNLARVKRLEAAGRMTPAGRAILAPTGPGPTHRAVRRCAWPATDPLMIDYHDREWGVPLRDDRILFEFLVLESAQAGLSWLTVLRKRENYRRAFAGFDPERVARFGPRDVARLLKDAGIIRNRAKIEAAINNAKRFLEVRDEFGSFATYMWGFVDGKPINARRRTMRDIPAVTPEAERFAKDLKTRGFKFLGPTVVYAHMQAVGMVNDHTVDCFRHRGPVKVSAA